MVLKGFTMVRTLILAGISSVFALASCSNGPTNSFNIEDLGSTVQKPRSDIPQIAAFDMQRCVNMGNSFEAPKDDPWGKPVNPADFETIRAKGFDTRAQRALQTVDGTIQRFQRF